MTDIVRPFQTHSDGGESADAISHYYANADALSKAQRLPPIKAKPLSDIEDIDLVDDVIDALMDPAQAKLARPVLRTALKEIAKVALLKKGVEPNQAG